MRPRFNMLKNRSAS